MKKWILIIGAITGMLLFTIIGTKMYISYEEYIAKKALIESLYLIETELIKDWSAQDTRNAQSAKDFIYFDLNDEQKEEFCRALESISIDEVSIGYGSPNRKNLDLWFMTTEEEFWDFRFDGEVVYIRGMPQKWEEENGLWPFEIRNEKLNEFLSGLLEQ